MAPTPNATPPWKRGPNEPQQPTDDRRQSKRASAPANIFLPIRDHSTPPRLGSSQSQSTQLLSLIPSHLSPQTTSALLAELVKPISPTDEEGYIYIFWLTPQTKQAPPESTARSLLSPPTRPDHDRRISDVMTEYSFHTSPRETAGPKNPEPKTIMLKIGRANNITRRMNEWQRQCGYALNLIRWYPHVPSGTTPVTSPLPSPRRTPNRQSAQPSLYPDLSPLSPSSPRRASETSSGFVRKVQNVKRVERLIHLELAERQVKRVCGACDLYTGGIRLMRPLKHFLGDLAIFATIDTASRFCFEKGGACLLGAWVLQVADEVWETIPEADVLLLAPLHIVSGRFMFAVWMFFVEALAD
ncbi:hypothetical protein MBLNU230_g2748t1 [Neophaeotheca triangularis]